MTSIFNWNYPSSNKYKKRKLFNEYKYSYLTDKAMLLDFPDTFSTIQNPKIFICVNLHYLKHEKSEI